MESDYSPRPRPEDFGQEAMDGFGEHGSGGWQFEGGEEAYDAAMAAWEKANASDHGLSPLLQQRDDAEREARFWKAKAEENANKLSERKTVHEWLNSLGTPDVEGTGKPMCLLRRLAVQLGIQPHFAEGSTREEYRRAIRGCAVSLDRAFSSRDETG